METKSFPSEQSQERWDYKRCSDISWEMLCATAKVLRQAKALLEHIKVNEITFTGPGTLYDDPGPVVSQADNVKTDCQQIIEIVDEVARLAREMPRAQYRFDPDTDEYSRVG